MPAWSPVRNDRPPARAGAPRQAVAVVGGGLPAGGTTAPPSAVSWLASSTPHTAPPLPPTLHASIIYSAASAAARPPRRAPSARRTVQHLTPMSSVGIPPFMISTMDFHFPPGPGDAPEMPVVVSDVKHDDQTLIQPGIDNRWTYLASSKMGDPMESVG